MAAMQAGKMPVKSALAAVRGLPEGEVHLFEKLFCCGWNTSPFSRPSMADLA